jgi:nicotinate-nucleotide--dimethylbenzimidazole phosphoribosyltransferase
MILTAADHGVAHLGVSAYPRETTIQMTRNYVISKGAVANALSRHCGADLVVVDMGVAGDLSDVEGILQRKIAYGTRNFTKEPAMTREQAVQALETGIAIACEQVSKGYKVFTVGEMGIGNTTASAAILAAFTGMMAEDVTGRGTGISDSRLAVKIEAVRKALEINKPDPRDGIDVLAKVGGFELGGLAGVMLGAAASNSLVVIDGFNAGAAAMVAHALHPECKQYLMGSHLSAERAHQKMTGILGLEPYVDMGLRLGEATGASLVVNFLDAAIKILHEMATFEDAGVAKSAEE